jgi:gluconolactonase
VRKMASAGAVCCLWAIAQTRGGPPRQFELKAESPKFWELFVQDAKLEKIAGGFGFTEGPVWDPHGSLYVSDEEKNRLSGVYPDGRVEALLDIGDPDGSALDAKGRLDYRSVDIYTIKHFCARMVLCHSLRTGRP